MIDKHALAATVGHACRPEWAHPAIRSWLAANYPHEPVERLVVAIALAALDPSAQTPGVLKTGGTRYWLPIGDTAGTPIPPPIAEAVAAAIAGDDDVDPRHYDGLTCRVCGARFDTDTARRAHATGPAAECRANVNARGVALARQQLADRLHTSGPMHPEDAA